MVDKEHQPLFTIGIASYNYSNYILRGLEAIKNQSFKDYEILISDDCSTDNSLEVIKDFMNCNPELNIRLICGDKNEGLIANKNRIIRNCRGKYLILCDADDWMAEDCLEEIAKKIYAENPDRVIVEIAHIDQNGKIIQTEEIPHNQTKWGWDIHHGCANRVSILKEHNVQIENKPDDLFFVLEFSKYCRKISIINKTLYYWLVHLDSAGRKIKDDKAGDIINDYKRVFEKIDSTIEYVSKEQLDGWQDEIEKLRIVKLKMYYFAILFSTRELGFKTYLSTYNKLKKIMMETDKNYKKNKYLKNSGSEVLRAYAMKAIRACAMFERMHVFKIVLVGYYLLCRIVYIDQ